MNTKLVSNLRQAILDSDLQDGMTVSFHHHLRNGDYVLNLVMEEIAALGFHDLTLNASSLFDVHKPLLTHIRNGVVTRLLTDYVSSGIGHDLSEGIMDSPVEFRTHGTRGADICSGNTPIDVAFIAAPSSDEMGNCTGKFGPSACGSLGYAMPDAFHARFVIVITDNLVSYPMESASIPETCVDRVCTVSAIGDPKGIVSGTTTITRDPVGLVMARTAARVIRASGLLQDGFSFQTGAGGASLAAAAFLRDMMKAENIHGSFGLGGITGYLVDMLRDGCFEKLMDVQCFDLKAVESIREDPRHIEIAADRYASAEAKSCAANNLDVVILGATQIDTDFNVNVHTDSSGRLMGGSGGHSDTAAGAKLSMIIAPLFRARLPIVCERVNALSTPGRDIDVLVTQAGVAVNPAKAELAVRLKDAGIEVKDIRELKEIAESLTGVPKQVRSSGRIVANILYRDGAAPTPIYGV